MSEPTEPIVAVLRSMEGRAPGSLLRLVNFFLEEDSRTPIDERELVDALVTPEANAVERVRFQLLISGWDGATHSDWTGSTKPHTPTRRDLIHDKLGLSQVSRTIVDAAFPQDPGAIAIVGSEGDWRPWYDPARRAERDFYWRAYTEVLESDPGWSPSAIGRLHTATDTIVQRLADPSWSEGYQSKGLVVGHVQSGKTANFTGVIAKAIDAGYRLIIVLTGTVEILRRQTQRRLDMELVGVENILGGIDEADEARLAQTDYYDDQDWIDGKFIRHGVSINDLKHVPVIRRLSTYAGDYTRLRQGLNTLDFRGGRELVDHQKPLYDPINLFSSDVRLAVVKKNSTVLKRLVDDLGDIHADLREIPTLIIDDEADLASPNTKRQKNPTAEEVERSAVNQRISDLLKLLERAQYIGYTATPFANVFVDPDDAEDIFPKDFIVSLDRPAGYMGARDFHDLDVDFAGVGKSIENSNEKAYVRDIVAIDNPDMRRSELQAALDSYVLTGAIKLFRKEPTGLRFRHHTMLVHESVKQIEHRELAREVVGLWRRSGYSTPGGLARLRALYESDFVPVSAALGRRAAAAARQRGVPVPSAQPLPADFDELTGWIGKAVDLIDTGAAPVMVVNGAKDEDYDRLDFQAEDVWKILVGGTKLSRGFTVEGLTVSYYTRRTYTADTLMQMGRWFGFRRGYGDLVRLFIGRNVPETQRGRFVDLYKPFSAVVQDEEDFRAELEQYASLNEETGEPQITPADVPPMVFQQVPWLKPTAGNKMYNAKLTREGIGGKLRDFPRQPERGNGSINAKHFKAVGPLLTDLQHGDFEYPDPTSGTVTAYVADYGIVPAGIIEDVLAQFSWMPNFDFGPSLAFMREEIRKGTVRDFVVLVPDLVGSQKRLIGRLLEPLPILTRSRREDGTRGGFSGSSPRQRPAIETIAGYRNRPTDPPTVDGGPLAIQLREPTRGALLLSFALDNGDPKARPASLPHDRPVASKDVATLFSMALPYACAPSGRIGFEAKRRGRGAIIDSN